MADNAILATPGSGLTFASDQVGGIEYPRMKPVWGADGTVTDISAANPLPVVQTGTPSLPTGAATEATLAAASAKLPATLGQKAMAASLAVVLASDQSAIPASQSGTWNITNISGVVSLPTGAATEATLAAASAKLPATLGQKAMAASLAVVLASDQSAIPTSQSGTWNITNISGVISLPTGAATEATLVTAKNSLDVMDDWDETNRCAVNLIAGQVGVQGASGAVSALTQRVVLATDVALPSGSNTIGKVGLNSGTNAIGQVAPTSGLVPAYWDKAVRTVSSATVDVWDFTLVAVAVGTVTVTYSNAAHDDVNQVERTA